jgi:hypothetical protein
MTFTDILPRLEIAWASRQVAGILQHQPPGELVSVGFNEPSLPFLVGTRTRLTGAESVAPLLAGDEFRYLLLEGRQKLKLQEVAPGLLERLRLLEAFDSYNYSKGKKMRFELYAKP